MQTIQSTEEKIKRFRAANADPSKFAPCLECGEPIAREKIIEPRFMLCTCSCKRRFEAKAKADGHDSGMIVKRAFRDVFHISRGYDYRGRDIRDDMELLPDAVALLLAKSGAMEQPRLDEYRKRDFENLKDAFERGERRALLFTGCKGFDRTFFVKR